tara:strand:+ start:55 stop:1101 length:1047 start_codon:yes stop_codon:yes gene_type:complete
MSAEIKIFFEIAEKIFSKKIDHSVRINNSYDNRNFVELLNELKKSELTKLLMKEEFGGANLSLGEIVPLIKLSSKYGLPLPFSETIIANYILSEFNVKPLNDFSSLCYETDNITIVDNKVSGVFKSVPYLNLTNFILAKINFNNNHHLIYFENKSGKLKQLKNFLAEPRFDLKIENEELIYFLDLPYMINFENLISNIKSIQSVGAMEKILELCIKYCSDRKQFGRSLSKFQMIQNHISEIALETAASGASIAIFQNQSKNKELNENFFDLKNTAIAKIRTGLASGKIIAASHQAHGAMGFTKEYELSYFTKNLNSWRNDFGNETYWQNILGEMFLKQNKGMWEFLNQ